MPQKRLRVLLADDHEVVRLGLRSLLSRYSEFEVVGEAADGHQAVRLSQETSPDVVVMDVRMPGLSGIDACREIKRARPEVRVIMLTSYAEDDLLVDALEAGASGYVLKRVGSEGLVDALHAVARGESPVDPLMTARLFSHMRREEKHAEKVETLTERERDILAHIALGETNREIAHHVGLSEKTVRNYVSQILQKLALSNRAEAAAFAVRHGLVRDEM